MFYEIYPYVEILSSLIVEKRIDIVDIRNVFSALIGEKLAKFCCALLAFAR